MKLVFPRSLILLEVMQSNAAIPTVDDFKVVETNIGRLNPGRCSYEMSIM